MKIKQLLAVSLFLICTIKGFSQEYNCDIKQLQVNAYEFILKNLDSVKKHTPNVTLITASLEFGEKGELKKSGYYKSYGEKTQKSVKVWKELEGYIKTSFSLCPDSHFYNNRDYVSATTLKIPLDKPGITKAIKEITSEPGYIAANTGQKDIAKFSKYTIDIKSFTIGNSKSRTVAPRVLEPFKKEGTLDNLNSKMIKITDMYSIAFEVVKVPGNKTNYIKYKLYERVNNSGVIITSEGWRPIVNGKLELSVTGKRDKHEGVKKVDFEETFDLVMDITFQ